MKQVMLILTLCVTLLGSAHAMSFTNVTSPAFQGHEYSVVAWGDVDGNGYADLFLGVAVAGQSRLFLNTGSEWVNASTAYGTNAIDQVKSARFVDFDQDGRLDLLCLTTDEHGIEVYRQNSSARFQRVDLNFDEDTNVSVRAAVWCDADEDGVLDLLVSSRLASSDQSILMVQVSNEFTEVRGADGPFSETAVSMISSIDFDRDGDIDYLMSKSEGGSSLWTDNGREFRDNGPALELPDKLGQEGMTWADFNRDGRLDFYACGSPNNSCLYYQLPGDGDMPFGFEDRTDGFTNLRTVTAGVSSAHAVDANGDGWTDLFLVRGSGNIMLMNDHGTDWVQSGMEFELLQPYRGTCSCAWADYDNDGDLDVVMAQGRNGIKLFRNDTQMTHEYISLRLCGSDGSMTPAVNCLVEVEFPVGKQWAATSMYSSTIGGDAFTTMVYNPTEFHSEEWIVNILWPNGELSRLTQLDIPMNGIVELHMPEAFTPGDNTSLVAPITVPAVGNYPNPFNPTTNIEFTLSEASFITLSIYNLLGQEVATLASGNFEAGLHSLVFDATALPSGLYMARLNAPSGTAVHRMLLTK